MGPSHRRFVAALAGLFALIWSALAIAPVDRGTWALENVLVLLFAAALVATWRRHPFSRASYAAIFLFLSAHVVGAHYTYSLVPYEDGWRALTGRSLNDALGWTRNNYDRVVHFLFGLLLAYPLRELVLRVDAARGWWSYVLPAALMMTLSAMYELTEWLAAVVFGGDLGAAFLGTQGDEWDAQKDTALASAGALAAMLATAACQAATGRDFAREWNDRLRRERPLRPATAPPR
jgi:putative membrane protein